MRRKKSKNFKSIVSYLLVISALSLSGYAYHALSQHLQTIKSEFEVQDIHISGNELLGRKEILRMIGVKKGEKLLAVQVDNVAGKLLESPYIKAAGAVYSLPSTLRIRVEERKPVAFVYGRGLNLIDKTGFIMPIPRLSKSWDFPVITGVKENIGVQGRITTSPRIKQVLALLTEISEMKTPFPQLVSELNCADKRFLQIHLNQGPTVLRVNYKDCLSQLFVAAGYLHDYADFGRLSKIDYIDLRFSGQIVVREKRG